ncbi:hypothetical protein M0R45_026358 [Rubus argutus]|uniref:Uncharacterized protein n=1 Tax=Rubus argutus TaxID=59490 RepID=A0AAW1WYM5_RUBAR
MGVDQLEVDATLSTLKTELLRLYESYKRNVVSDRVPNMQSAPLTSTILGLAPGSIAVPVVARVALDTDNHRRCNLVLSLQEHPVHIFFPPRAQPRRAIFFSRRRFSQASAETSLRLLLTLTAIQLVLRPASAQPSVRASTAPSLSSQPWRRFLCPLPTSSPSSPRAPSHDGDSIISTLIP